MNKIIVGSSNPVKIEAVRRVVQRVWETAVVAGIEVGSGVSPQPLTDEEAIQGAINRARNVLAAQTCDLAVGIEGNTVDTLYGMFSTGWVAFTDANGKIGLGSAGRYALPDVVANAIRNGSELGPLMDQLTGGHNTKQKEGAVGVFSSGLLKRTEALEIGVICALCRFVSPEYYR